MDARAIKQKVREYLLPIFLDDLYQVQVHVGKRMRMTGTRFIRIVVLLGVPLMYNERVNLERDLQRLLGHDDSVLGQGKRDRYVIRIEDSLKHPIS